VTKRHRKPDPTRPAASRAPVVPKRPRWLTVAVVAGVGAVAYVFAFCWLAGTGIWAAPLLVGASIALILVKPKDAALAAAIAGAVGALVAVAAFRADYVLSVLQTMPTYANPDVPSMLYEMVYEYVLAHPATTWGQSSPVLILIGAVGTGGVAYGTAWLLEIYAKSRPVYRQVVAWGIVAVLCLTYVVSVVGISAKFIEYANQEPQSGQYAFDGSVYIKTYYNMVHGQDYYTAILNAAAGDSRLIKEKAIRNGKFYSWFNSPGFVRIPITFYLWKYAAPNGAGGVVYLAALLSAAALAAVYWGASARIGPRALVVALFVFPYLLFTSLSFNIFFNDYWAGLAVLASASLLLRREWVAALVLACLAAICRDVLLVWFIVLIGVCAFSWWKQRSSEWRTRTLVGVAGLLVYGAVYAWNYANAARIVAGTNSAAPLQLVLALLGNSLVYKIVQPTSFMMFPYGYFVLPGLVLWLLGPLGLWALSGHDTPTRFALMAWAAYWLVFYLAFGVSSSYWGQHTMSIALMGMGCLLISLDQLDSHLELRCDLGWDAGTAPQRTR
jgi:hypothetical protein